MCGIAGGWHQGGFSSEVIDSALDKIRHRGPDDQGSHVEDHMFIGMRRLSIIDLAGGHQPIYNEKKDVCVVFNGEIYNYLEIIPDLKSKGHQFRTESDTEVLVHLYEQYGVQMVNKLRGMFAFAIWDSVKKIFFLARDRFGKKPLFYHQPKSGGFIFASEIKALKPLIAHLGEGFRVSNQSIYNYLSLLVVPQPQTIFEDVFALPPGTCATFSDQGLAIRKYWEMPLCEKSRMPYEEILVSVRELISECVKIRLRSDVPLGVFLSGGVDSSIIAYEAARVSREPLHSFTISMDDAQFDESPVARLTAERLGIKNTVLPLKVDPLESLSWVAEHFDQPFGDSSAIPSFAVSKLARQHVKVVLNGDGGDELFCGYRRYIAARQLQKLQLVPKSIAKLGSSILGSFFPDRRSPLGLYARFLRGRNESPSERFLAWTTDMLIEGDKKKYWRGAPASPTEEFLDRLEKPDCDLHDVDLQRLQDIKVILLSALLVKMDMATMAASIEARSPLMDHVLGEFAARLTPAILLRGGRSKAVLRDAYKGLLPDEVIFGKKKGFEIPLHSWLKGPFKPLLHDTLSVSSARIKSYLDPDFVNEVIDGRQMTERNWAYVVYSFLVLELWLRKNSTVA